MLDNLYLLFLARQGYWDNRNTLDKRNLFHYIYQYIVISLILFLIMSFIHNDLVQKLQQFRFYGRFNYYQLFLLVSFTIIPVGVIYENYLVFKNHTIETLNIFLYKTLFQIHFSLLLKNIIISPLLTVLYFSHFLWVCLLFFISHTFSLLLGRLFWKTKRIGKTSNIDIIIDIQYIFSLLGILPVLKAILIPIFSSLLFMMIVSTGSNFISYNLNDSFELVLTDILLANIMYSSKGLPYLLLGMINEIPYLQILKINVYCLLIGYILGLLSAVFCITSLPIFVFLCYNNLSGFEICLFILILLIVYLTIHSFQMKEAVQFKTLVFRTVQELESYKSSLKQQIIFWIKMGILTLLYTVVLIVPIQSRFGYLFLVLTVYLFLFVYNTHTSIKSLLTKEEVSDVGYFRN